MNVRRLLVKHLGSLVADTRGATAVEYGLILALIVIAVIFAIMSVADVTTDMWTNVADKVTRAR